MADEAQKPPIEQLVDLFVYAPIGLLYEYPDVMDKIVKRGRSQTQLAKLMAQMAARQGANGAQQGLDAAVTDLAGALARCITEVGQRVGLAPDDVPPAPASSPMADHPPAGTPSPPDPAPAVLDPDEQEATSTIDESSETTVLAELAADEDSEPAAPDAEALPIAGYTELKARQIVGLLGELDAGELERVRAFETANRHRKTVLAKIDTLLANDPARE